MTGSPLAVAGTLLLVGLAGSLHCVGMCGPLLLAFGRALQERERDSPRRGSGWIDYVGYHSGRVWTYGLLGLLAGLLGQRLREVSALLGWQRPLALVLGVSVALVGIALSGWLPGLDLSRPAERGGSSRLARCGLTRVRDWPFVSLVFSRRGFVPRLLLGSLLGLLPCGLVYAMLVVVSTLPSPLLGALGMMAFGLGTVPALSVVLLVSRRLPQRWRASSTGMIAAGLILVGLLMTWRAASGNASAHAPHAAIHRSL